MNDLELLAEQHLCPTLGTPCEHVRTCNLIRACIVHVASSSGTDVQVGSVRSSEDMRNQKAQCVRCGRTYPDTTHSFPLKDPRLDLLDHLGVSDYQCKACIRQMLVKPPSKNDQVVIRNEFEQSVRDSMEVMMGGLDRTTQDIADRNYAAQIQIGILVFGLCLVIGAGVFMVTNLLALSLFFTAVLNHVTRWAINNYLSE